MFIKWRYNDHGCSDGYEELEVPDNFDGWASVEEYICHLDLVPTYSERFSMGRIKWEKLENPSAKFILDEIKNLEREIVWKQEKIVRYKTILDTTK